MGAGASSVAALRPIRAERCSAASSSFDGLALLADGKPCGCKICAKREGRAAPLMDKDDAYTLTTAMRVIDRSQAKVMPPRAAPAAVATTPGAEPAAAAAAATAASSPVFDDSPAKPAIEAYSRKIVSDGAQILQRRALGDRTNTAGSRICTSTWQKGLGAGRPKPARELPPE